MFPPKKSIPMDEIKEQESSEYLNTIPENSADPGTKWNCRRDNRKITCQNRQN